MKFGLHPGLQEGRTGGGTDVRSPDLQSHPEGRDSSMITDEKKELLALHRLQQANQAGHGQKYCAKFVLKLSQKDQNRSKKLNQMKMTLS
jgi:hypothetical protein